MSDSDDKLGLTGEIAESMAAERELICEWLADLELDWRACAFQVDCRASLDL